MAIVNQNILEQGYQNALMQAYSSMYGNYFGS